MGIVKSIHNMSWSVQFIGKPEKVIEALNAQSNTLSGESKAEYDNALPHLTALVGENFGLNLAVKLSANGHGIAGGDKPSRQLTASLELIYGLLE